jgi:hypothetical protein
MIDLSEHIISLSQAAKLMPRLRCDRPCNPSTIWRWCTRGVRGVRLESIRVGGTTATSQEALARFLEAINKQANGPLKRHSTHHERTEAELTRRGI